VDDRGTISDFSEQWTNYFDNSGYFGSEALFVDVLAPLVGIDELRGATVAEIGCGNGRFLKVMARHAAKVVGIDPGDSVVNARAWTRELDNVEVVRASVYDLPPCPRSTTCSRSASGIIFRIRRAPSPSCGRS
jgi:2-polyprenyl-3-methyl-5-hydroxy-6-metoxy-1,4-benzoquinol methylase